MKILKKSLALLLAITMVLGLVAVNVSAAAGSKYELNVGSATVLRNGEDNEVEIPLTIETDDVGIVSLTVTVTTEAGTITDLAADESMDALGPVSNPATGKIVMSGSRNKTFGAETAMGLATITVPADIEVGEYAVNLTVNQAKYINESSRYSDAEFTVNVGTITVIEEKYISSIYDETVGEIEYAAAETPDAPDMFTGVGVTSTGEETIIEITDGFTWDDEINTLQVPDDYEITGTVAAPEIENLYFVDGEDRVDTLPAKYTYTIVKTDEVVVDSAAVEVLHSRNGADITDVLTLAEYATEIETVNVTAAESDGAAVFAAGLDWENAEITGGASLNVADVEDTVTLSVPLTGESIHYDLSNAVAEVTFTVVPAEEWVTAIDDSVVTIEYAAEAPEFPAYVTGSGKTASGDTPLMPAPIFDTVVWDDVVIDTTPDTLVDQIVTGTVAAPEEGLIKFKNEDFTADVEELDARFIVKFTKTDDIEVGTIEDVFVPQVRDGAAITEVADIVAYAEGITTVDVVALAGGDAATCEATLNWEAATITGGTSLDIATLEDTVTLTVPLTGETDYYLIDGKSVEVTFVVVPAEIPGCAVLIPNTNPAIAPSITFTMPTDALKIEGDAFTGTIALTITVGEETYVENIDASNATIVVVDENAKVTVVPAVALKDMGIGLDAVKVTFTVNAEYDGAELVFDDGNTFYTFLYGDADSDGEITGLDATVIKRHVAGYDEEIDLIAADVDADGEVTGLDATIVMRTVAGYYEQSELPLAD